MRDRILEKGDTTMTEHRDGPDRTGLRQPADQQGQVFRDCLESRLAPMLSIAQLMNGGDTQEAQQKVHRSAVDAYVRLNGEMSFAECAEKLSNALVRHLVPDERDLERASSSSVTVDPVGAGLDNQHVSTLSQVEAEAVVFDADTVTVRDAFHRLPKLERLVLAMITVGNHTTLEVSRMLDTTRDVVRRLRGQAQRRLQHELASLTSAGG